MLYRVHEEIAFGLVKDFVLHTLGNLPNVKLMCNHHLSEPLAFYHGSFSAEWVDGYYSWPAVIMIQEARANFIATKSIIPTEITHMVSLASAAN